MGLPNQWRGAWLTSFPCLVVGAMHRSCSSNFLTKRVSCEQSLNNNISYSSESVLLESLADLTISDCLGIRTSPMLLLAPMAASQFMEDRCACRS